MSPSLTLEVDGVNLTLDVSADTEISDLTEDMAEMASKIAWYGRVLASCRQSADVAEDGFRAWKATTIEAILADDPKKAEWKCKAALEAHPGWARHKGLIANTWREVNEVEAALNGLRAKADMLRSLGAAARSEMDTIGLSTPNSSKLAAMKAALTSE